MNISIEKLKKIYNKYRKFCLPLIVLFIFLLLAVLDPSIHDFNKDEIHAWNIAANLNFIEIIKLMRAEGHTFIWYMLLKPFTYNQELFFPWIIKWLNFLFIFLGLVLMWLKSPQNTLLKILITFSLPFTYLAILGRCYGIGIFLLSCIAALYNKRFIHPVLFSVLLFLTANTSFIATLAILGISLYFLLDLVKDNLKKNILPLIILLFIPVSLFIQWHNPVMPDYINFYRDSVMKHLFLEYDHITTPLVPQIIIISGLFLCLAYFKTNKRVLFYFLSGFSLFFFFSLYIYPTFNYHYQFMFLFLCFCDWIFINAKPKSDSGNKITIVFNIWFVILCILFSPMIRKNGQWFLKKDDYTYLISCIYEYIPSGSVIYSSMYSMGYEIPYLKDKYVLKTFKGGDLLSFEAFYNAYKREYITNYNESYLKSLPKDKVNKYIFVDPWYAMHEKPSSKLFGEPKKCFRMNIYKLN